jgi:hypothetical protein
MLKKLTLVLCSVLFFSVPTVSIADHHDNDLKVKEFKEVKYKFINNYITFKASIKLIKIKL